MYFMRDCVFVALLVSTALASDASYPPAMPLLASYNAFWDELEARTWLEPAARALPTHTIL